jgi:hypothetical protein
MTASPQELESMLTPERLPRVAFFLDGYLHQDFAAEHGSAAGAAWDYAQDAELDELEELGAEWAVVRAAAEALPLARFNRLLGERFGSSWQATAAAEVEAVGREIERALRE